MRIAILGCGSIGRRHAQNARALGHDDVVTYDPHAPADVSSLDELWQREPQVAIVAAPTQLHTDLALAAAQHGCDLFIEKPLSHTLERVDDVIAETDRRGLLTMVGCNMRFHHGPATIRRLVDSGAIGRILGMRLHTGSYLPRWRPAQDYRESYSASRTWGGATLDCIHELDLALWLGGPASVAGAAAIGAQSIGLDTDGMIEIVLRHDSGTISSVHLDFIARDYRRGCTVIGTDGTLEWDFGRRRVDRFDASGECAESFAQPDDWQMNDMYVGELRHFFDCVALRRPAPNPLREAAATLRLALEARAIGGWP